MTRYTGINHLAMATKDMDQTIRFWRDLLGMRLVAGLGRPGYRHYFFEISPMDMIAFFEWPQVQSLPEKDHGHPVKGPFAFDHVSIGVTDQNDLWHIYDALSAAGFWVSEIIDHGFILSIYSFDPNGIPIEFSCPTQSLDLRKSPRLVDKHPSPIALEGSGPISGQWPSPTLTNPMDRPLPYPGEGRDLLDQDKSHWKP